MTRNHRAFALAALCAVVFSSSSCRVLQYNIANGNEHPDADSGNRGQVDVAAILSGSERPTVITLNEVCWAHFDSLNRIHAIPHGYVGSFQSTNPHGCGASGDPFGFGNAVFVHGTLLEGRRAVYEFDRQGPGECEPFDPTDPDNNPECKGMMCVGFAPAGFGRAIACVLHLSPSPASAAVQAAEALDFTTFIWLATGQPLAMIGGDFNLTPGAAGMRPWHESPFRMINRADVGTADDGRTIDYVFATNTALPFRGWVQPSNNSDHHMVFSQVWE